MICKHGHLVNLIFTILLGPIWLHISWSVCDTGRLGLMVGMWLATYSIPSMLSCSWGHHEPVLWMMPLACPWCPLHCPPSYMDTRDMPRASFITQVQAWELLVSVLCLLCADTALCKTGGLSLTCFNFNPSNSIHYKVWNEITYPFPNFNSATVEVWERISNFIPHFTRHMEHYLNYCNISYGTMS